MAPRKRAFSEVDAPEPPKQMGLLDRIRNMWEFAAVMQWITTFGDVVKIDKEFDINEFEDECMKPEPSDKLEDVGLCLLKWISSHRGLTLEIWDEYTRRQYLAKAPEKNPYGDDENPKKFREFDIFTKIKVLHQLTIWTLWNPDRMREKMPEQTEPTQTDWRIDEFGWDRDDRTYFLLDDNRLYRRTDPPIPTEPVWKPKSNTIKAKAARKRDRKRRRTRADGSPDADDDEDESKFDGDLEVEKKEDTDEQGLGGGYQWECICVTLQQYKDFIETHRKSRDVNEKNLVSRLEADVLPILEKAEEAQLRKMQRREKELLNMEKLAGAKRSSRLADKHERERIQHEQEEAEKKRSVELAAARKMEEQQRKMEDERQSRIQTREQRIREREYKRILHEEELARMEAEAKRIEAEGIRGSRHLQANIEQAKKSLEELQTEAEWMFDCAGCGMHGKNFDDGAHSIQCEKCNTWQHSKCYGISQAEAEKEEFHFVCKDCIRREEEAKKPKIPPLKFRVGTPSSPPADHQALHVAKKQHNVTRRSSSPVMSDEQPHASAAPVFQPSQAAASNGHTSPQQLPPPQMYANMPSPTKQTPYLNGGLQSSPTIQRVVPPSPPAPNGLAFHPSPRQQSTHMSPAPHLSPVRPTAPPAPNYQQGGNSLSNGTPYHSRQSPSFSNPAVTATPATARTMPSPLQNRPSMSPTQGNPEVGPLAGVPTPKPSSLSPPSMFATPRQVNQAPNCNHQPVNPQMPSMSSAIEARVQTPLINHMSGRSPTKHSPTPTPNPDQSLQSSMSSSFGSQPSARSVSGTIIFPPSSTLQPSPKQLDKTPVPTPSKNLTPLQQGNTERQLFAGETRPMSMDTVTQPPPSHEPPKENMNGSM